MKTKTINLYTYDELNQNAKETALKSWREFNDYPFLKEDLEQELYELLEKNNIKITEDNKVKLFYSLSYCQGDGVCFIGEFQFKDIYLIKIKHNNRYYHKKSTDFYFINEEGEYIENNKNIEEFKEIYFSICDKLESKGYDIIAYEDSEETIKEVFTANDFYFNEKGEYRENNTK